MSNLAVAFMDVGQLVSAIRILERSVEAKRTKLGANDPDTIVSLNDLAVPFQEDGQLDRAIQIFDQILTVRRVNLDKDHPDTLSSMNSLAVAYLDAGEPDKAVAGHEQTLKVFQTNIFREVDSRADLRSESLDTDFCNSYAHFARVSPMRLQCAPTPRAIVNPGKTPQIKFNPTSAQRQSDGRRAGLKLRSPQGGVGSSPTFGN
jgi:tetratricopeptide (TPR) repeat protein